MLAVGERAFRKLGRSIGLMGDEDGVIGNVDEVWIFYEAGVVGIGLGCLWDLAVGGAIGRPAASIHLACWIFCVASGLVVAFTAGRFDVYEPWSICWCRTKRVWA